MHYEHTSHPLIINIKRTPKIRPDDEPPKKLTKLEIQAEEPESERYDFTTTVHCRLCNSQVSKDQEHVFIPHMTRFLHTFLASQYYSCRSFCANVSSSIRHSGIFIRLEPLRTQPPPSTIPQPLHSSRIVAQTRTMQ
jgi:uncharacterized UBP type Zn finger protein